MTVPVGAPLDFELTSASVMNVFFVPQLGSMIYTMNGMVTRLNLHADRRAIYHGLSAHFSGDGFPDMAFDVHVVSPTRFPEWVGRPAQSDRRLTADVYRELAAQVRCARTSRPTGSTTSGCSRRSRTSSFRRGQGRSCSRGSPILSRSGPCSVSSTGRRFRSISRFRLIAGAIVLVPSWRS